MSFFKIVRVCDKETIEVDYVRGLPLQTSQKNLHSAIRKTLHICIVLFGTVGYVVSAGKIQPFRLVQRADEAAINAKLLYCRGQNDELGVVSRQKYRLDTKYVWDIGRFANIWEKGAMQRLSSHFMLIHDVDEAPLIMERNDVRQEVLIRFRILHFTLLSASRCRVEGRGS